jgi:hypothetical protein
LTESKIERKLVAVRIDTRLHAAALLLCATERAAGRKYTITDYYEAALRFHGAAANEMDRRLAQLETRRTNGI